MGLVDEALTEVLTGRTRLPTSINQLAEAFGPTARQQNPALQRLAAGLSPDLRVKDMSAEQRREYRAAQKRIERYRKGQRRPERSAGGRALLAQLRDAVRRQLAGNQVAQARRGGLLMRLRAYVRVSRVWKVHTMPADLAGQPRYQHIPGEKLGPTLDAWEAGRMDEAGDELLAAFFAAYNLSAEVGELESVQLRLR